MWWIARSMFSQNERRLYVVHFVALSQLNSPQIHNRKCGSGATRAFEVVPFTNCSDPTSPPVRALSYYYLIWLPLILALSTARHYQAYKQLNRWLRKNFRSTAQVITTAPIYLYETERNSWHGLSGVIAEAQWKVSRDKLIEIEVQRGHPHQSSHIDKLIDCGTANTALSHLWAFQVVPTVRVTSTINYCRNYVHGSLSVWDSLASFSRKVSWSTLINSDIPWPSTATRCSSKSVMSMPAKRICGCPRCRRKGITEVSQRTYTRHKQFRDADPEQFSPEFMQSYEFQRLLKLEGSISPRNNYRTFLEHNGIS